MQHGLAFMFFPKAPPELGSRLDFGVQGLASAGGRKAVGWATSEILGPTGPSFLTTLPVIPFDLFTDAFFCICETFVFLSKTKGRRWFVGVVPHS